MPENVTISYRGAGYEIGRGDRFYGIWAAGSAQAQPLEWWPETSEGWSGAWTRFTALAAPGTITPVSQRAETAAGPAAEPDTGMGRGAMLAAALLALGVSCGIAGISPGYLGGASLARQPAELVPHLIYLAAWTASAVLIARGGVRRRAGALLGLGTSAVTFGFFFADVGQAIAASGHLVGAGLVLGVVGWLACAAGSVVAFRLSPAMAFRFRPTGGLGRPRSDDMGPVVMLMLAALGTAVAFAPSWDRYVLRVATGASQVVTAGNAFANPAPVIVGNVAVMVALVAVAAAAALWRPIRLGAALLAGAIIPMAAQAISALIQAGEAVSPTQFGFSPSAASLAGLTISSGVTAAFWIYCAFLVALIASFAWMLIPPHPAVPQPPRLPQAGSPQAGSPEAQHASPSAAPASHTPPTSAGASAAIP